MSAPARPFATETVPPAPDAYDPAAIEQKWQTRWRDQGTNATDLTDGPHPFYALMMFPYPSAEGLHVGNLFAFTGNDIFARYQRMRGRTVFEPLGYDAFGIHSENYALKIGVHPKELIPRNIANFRRQLERAGLMVDWRYLVDTTDPAYYRWTQWVFLQLFARGLAYKKKAAVNWCPFDKTVLANEQVIDGACERCGSKVEQRYLEQWFFGISRYAPRLLANLDSLDWSEKTKTQQRNWIGRSEGAELTFVAGADPGVPITVFTTRADTIFGATYLVLAPEHPAVERLTTPSQRAVVAAYREQAMEQDLVSRRIGSRDKTGVFTGSYATNPATGRPIPVWVADYVLVDYGTGAVMAVPGHDQRDYEFAQIYGLPIVRVVAADAEGQGADARLAEAYTGPGRAVRSGEFTGLDTATAKQRIVSWLAQRGSARVVENYRIHDWCISRQRYWGPPIPIIYCDACGAVPVPERDLPVVLPDIPDFRPDDSGVSPLARHEEWYRVPCPQCGGEGRRETDVSDTFLDSGWYFLRYPSADRNDVAFDPVRTRRWLPVDSYIGGNEHAVLHLLYARFLTMVLHDAGYLEFEEPFTRFRAHGLIVRDGAKMSKSRGNVVTPDAYIPEWGADTLRTYLMFIGPFEQGGDFQDRSISGARSFLNRLWASAMQSQAVGAPDPSVVRALHRTIRKVTEDIPRLSYNTAIAAMMAYMNELRAGERTPHRTEVEALVQLVAPFAPHLAEELWQRLGHDRSVFDSDWPGYDPALVADETVTIAIQVNGKLRGTVTARPDATESAVYGAALADPGIAKYVTGDVAKIVFVPGRLMNIVVKRA